MKILVTGGAGYIGSRTCVALLRHYNPVGAHQSSLIGEEPSGVLNNLMPYIIQVAGGRLKKLKVFGDDYPTVDGNGVSDYIYVCDLAEGHVAALEKLEPGVRICNPGTGRGTSELELIKTFGEVKGLKLDYEIAGRRPAEGKTPGAGFYGPGYRSPNPPRMAAVFS